MDIPCTGPYRAHCTQIQKFLTEMVLDVAFVVLERIAGTGRIHACLLKSARSLLALKVPSCKKKFDVLISHIQCRIKWCDLIGACPLKKSIRVAGKIRELEGKLGLRPERVHCPKILSKSSLSQSLVRP